MILQSKFSADGDSMHKAMYDVLKAHKEHNKNTRTPITAVPVALAGAAVSIYNVIKKLETDAARNTVKVKIKNFTSQPIILSQFKNLTARGGNEPIIPPGEVVTVNLVAGATFPSEMDSSPMITFGFIPANFKMSNNTTWDDIVKNTDYIQLGFSNILKDNPANCITMAFIKHADGTFSKNNSFDINDYMLQSSMLEIFQSYNEIRHRINIASNSISDVMDGEIELTITQTKTSKFPTYHQIKGE